MHSETRKVSGRNLNPTLCRVFRPGRMRFWACGVSRTGRELNPLLLALTEGGLLNTSSRISLLLLDSGLDNRLDCSIHGLVLRDERRHPHCTWQSVRWRVPLRETTQIRNSNKTRNARGHVRMAHPTMQGTKGREKRKGRKEGSCLVSGWRRGKKTHG